MFARAPVIPWSDLQDDEAQGGASHLRIEENYLHWCSGNLSPFIRHHALLPALYMCLHYSFPLIPSLLSAQVREEIYTAFNTVHTVLLEFKKP